MVSSIPILYEWFSQLLLFSWKQKIVRKLFALDRNTWYYITMQTNDYSKNV